MSVVVLCAARKSVYHEIPGIEVYDESRDARSYSGGSPVICHPPCRAWSAFCGHQAKPKEGERDLGIWCCDTLRRCGGILEQPAFSRLFDAGGLPKLGCQSGDLATIEVWQSWWGFGSQKKTWLCLSRIDPGVVEIPFRLTPRGSKSMDRMSKRKRSATTREFAEWLIDLAAQARNPAA